MQTKWRFWLLPLALIIGVFLGFVVGVNVVGVNYVADPVPFAEQPAPAVSSSQFAFERQQLTESQLPTESRTREAQIPSNIVYNAGGFLAKLELNTPEEIENALVRAEELHRKLSLGQPQNSPIEPLEIVVHGPEVAVFFGENYAQYKNIVDIAARLSAFNIVNVKVCKTQINHVTNKKPHLPPFVEEIPYGPSEIERLVDREGFVYF